MKKRLWSILMTACLLVGLLPTVALAAEGDVDYLYCDANGANWQTGTKKAGEYTVVTGSDTTWGDDGNDGWYVVNSNVEIGSRVTVSGDVHLILADGCELTVNGGIQVEDPNALTIYAQSTNESTMGKLSANTVGGHAGIGGGAGGASGGSGGTITINGGSVETTSIGGGAGIGGGTGIGNSGSGGSGGTITINGGSVTATCDSGGGAGIGGGMGIGSGGSGGTITINGGSVTATCNTGGAGIGGGIGIGSGGSAGTITINGGSVETTSIGGGGIGIGSGGSAGTFQTNGGNAVIFASSIADKSNQSTWSGIIFEGDSGAVYGTQTLTGELTIPAGTSLTIPEGKTLTIPAGVTLTINGTLTNNGTIINFGTITGTVSGNPPKVGVTAKYLDETGEEQTAFCDTAITADNPLTTLGEQGKTTWYVVTGDVEIDSHVTVNGNVHLILADDCKLTVENGIVGEGDLTVYAQSTGDAQGSMRAVGPEGSDTSCGIQVSDMTVNGGSVTATGGAAKYNGYGYSCGIYADGSVTISGSADVTAKGGDTDYESDGIYADGSVTISGGTVHAEGGAAENAGYGCSYGISAYDSVTISGSADVTAKGGDTDCESSGISAYGDDGENYYGDVIISGGTVTATGGAAYYASDGIYAGRSVAISGGRVDAKGGTAVELSDGIFVFTCDVTISGGTVYAEGGTAKNAGYGCSCGISASAGVTISGSADATAKGGDTDYESYGIFAYGHDGSNYYGDVTISGGTVTVTGGAADDSSFGIYAHKSMTINGGHVTARTLADNGSHMAFYSQPDLSAFHSYQWRIGESHDFTPYPTTPYGYSDTHTYVEITDHFTITLDPNYEGGKSGTVTTGADGKLTEDLPTPTRSGYTFAGWYLAADGDEKVTNETEFNKNTTIYAHWTAKSSGSGGVSTYGITVESAKNGDVTSSHKTASKGTTVTLTVEPDKGYTLETLTVTDKNGNEIELTDKGDGKYTFKMPGSKVTVKATFMEDNSMLNFFVDVPADAYYETAVLWAAENGITGGTDATHFSPNAPCTRAQIVTFLWRAAGSPEPESLSSFADVPADSYYAKAVAWAVENGITTGTGDGTTFSPNATCTRAQAMAFIYRSEQARGGGMQGQWMFRNPFSDVDLESYYGEAVMWAVANGVTGGTTATTFSPNANCTRAQIVTFLYRCLGQ